MNKTTEALKFAEEALEDISDHTPIGRNVALKAISAIREALAEQEEKQLFLDQVTYGTSVSVGGKRTDPADFYVEPVKQEPVAWMVDGQLFTDKNFVSIETPVPLYAAPVQPVKQEEK